MATQEELYTALRNADSAGDTEGARKLAAYIQQSMAAQPAAQTDFQKDLRTRNPAEYDPQSPEFQAKWGPTSGMTGTQKFFAGAGKSVVDLGRGVRQLGAEALDVISPREQTLSGLIVGQKSRGDELRAQQDETNKLDSPLMHTGAGVAGNVAGTLATTLLPASLAARGAQVANLARTASVGRAFLNPATYRAAAAAGAVQGALQPVGVNESRAQNVGVGAATGLVGQGLVKGIGRLAQPLSRNLGKEDAAAAKVLMNAGVPLDAAQRSGSKTAQVLKRAVADNPLSSSGAADFQQKQGAAFTRAVLKTIGEDADAATGDVMGAAKDRIGQVFDDIATRNPVKYDAALHKDIADLATQAHKELPPDAYKVVANQIEDVFTKAQEGGGLIDGKAYQNLRSSLGRVEQTPGALGHWAGELRSTIDDALKRSVGPDDLAALKQARTQYRRMKQIEGAIDKEGGGVISPSKLANSLGTKANRSSSVYGRGDLDLVKLAQAGKKLLPDKYPNSGTAHRLATQLGVAGVAGLATGYGTGDTGKGVAAGLGAGGLLLGARGAMNNQLIARYLSEGLKAGPARNTLMFPQRFGAQGAAAAAGALPFFQE